MSASWQHECDRERQFVGPDEGDMLQEMGFDRHGERIESVVAEKITKPDDVLARITLAVNGVFPGSELWRKTPVTEQELLHLSDLLHGIIAEEQAKLKGEKK